MVQKNSTNRPVRSRHTVVEFEGFEVPDFSRQRADAFLKKHKRGHHRQVPLSGGASKFKGVNFRKANRYNKAPWRAQLVTSIDKVRHSIELGMFIDEKDAARAYDKAAFELWGDEALTNQQYYGDL